MALRAERVSSGRRADLGSFRRGGNLETMSPDFPQAVPEIPVQDVEKAAAYYGKVLGFQLDWGDDRGGIAGISQGACRLFLTNARFRDAYGTSGPAVIWINLESRQAVDALFDRWRSAGAWVLAEPQDQPWHLREFRVGDLDGNQLRVFYDFGWELRPGQ